MFKAEGDQITITMPREDYNSLLILLGAGTGVFGITSGILAFINRLNEGNPNFLPYCTDGADAATALEPKCRICGCTEFEPCNPPCAWVMPGLCSICALAAVTLRDWGEAAHAANIGALVVEAASIELPDENRRIFVP